MHRLPRQLNLIVVAMLFCGTAGRAQHPHGEGFRIDCAVCHSPSGWQVDWAQSTFDHAAASGFALDGQHAAITCADCHAQNNFLEASPDCVACHNDVHQMTVGDDCVRCHNVQNWLVMDIYDLHEMNGFVLEGGHSTAACIDCHASGNPLAWERLSTNCIDCHQADYVATVDPDHALAGYGTDCMSCHDAFAYDWSSPFFHGFFPLEGGHMGPTCVDCHNGEPFEAASPECVTCHLEDFMAANDPDHVASGFPQDCTACHTTAPGWNASNFVQHDDLYFPIYSGEHQGEWTSCTDCHTTPGDYAMFSCVDCHEHDDPADLADEHDDVGGYVYDSQACFECHPTGDE